MLQSTTERNQLDIQIHILQNRKKNTYSSRWLCRRIPRSLSNKGIVYLNGKKYPVVGRICMDQCMVSLGTNGEGYVGDEVELWGNKISLHDIAKRSERSMWDLLSNVTERVPRKYIK